MECPHCGAKNAFRAKFCRRCAQRLDTLAENGGESALPLVEPIVHPAKNSNRLVVFLLLLLVITGWYFLRPAKPGTESVSAQNTGAAPEASQQVAKEPPPQVIAPTVADSVATPTVAADNHAAAQGEKTEERKNIKMDETAERAKPKPPKVQSMAARSPASAAEPVQPQPKLAAASAAEPESGLAAELGACNAHAFLAKALCIERTRWKYCPGEWGKIPDCPKPENGESGG